MATFSVNQVSQLYVAKELKSPKVLDTDAAGSIAVKSDTNKNHLYFQYKSPGGIVRSDLINIKNIISAKATDADNLARELVRYKIVVDSTVNDGNPVGGQDYLLRIAFRNYIGLSPEDQYFKYGMVHAYTGMTPSNFYKEMVISLVKNFSPALENGLLKFYLETSGSSATEVGTLTEVTDATKPDTLSGTYTGIVLEEKPQEWILGTFPQVPVYYTPFCSEITVDGDQRFWGIVNKVASVNKIDNGKKIADLEFFCMGERGDVYRMIGYPNVIRTTYLVDPTIKYNMINIHYSYVGNNENVQASEKDLIIVVPKVGENNQTSNKLTNDIIDKINTATGLTIAKLDASGGD